MLTSIVNWFWYLLWLIGIGLCKLLQIFYTMFSIFAGTQKVTYHESQDFLLNIFVGNDTITTIYGGMAMIGITLLFGFTILAVIKKMFDLGDKMQQPLSEILRKALTSFVFIISMTFILSATVQLSNRLLKSIEYLFNNAYTLSNSGTIEFTDDEYATMARIFDTIGEYSINPSANSRYNINSCYNEIRADLQRLESQHVFNFTYTTVDGVEVESWQSVISQIARAHDLSTEQPLDEYSDALSSAIEHAMTYVRINKDNMQVLTKYSSPEQYTEVSETRIDVMLFLAATTDAAHNSAYNGTSASYYDPVRKPYLDGTRDMYSESDVKQDFSLAMPEYQHFILIFGGFMLCRQFFVLVLNCIGRLFNMILLYILAPPFIAAAPFDDGSRFKQWTTAFIIQTFAIFGTILSVRLLLIFIPIIFDANLSLFSNGTANMFAKMLMLYGSVYTAEKASGMLTGILSENAAMQSIMASDTATSIRNSTLGRLATETPGLAAKGVIKGGFAAAGALVKGVGSGARSLYTKNQQRNNNRALKSSLSGSAGEDAAKNFLDMDKQAAMKKYGMSSKTYDSTRAQLATRVRHGWNNEGPTKTPPEMRNGGGNSGNDGPRNLHNMTGQDGSVDGARQDGQSKINTQTVQDGLADGTSVSVNSSQPRNYSSDVPGGGSSITSSRNIENSDVADARPRYNTVSARTSSPIPSGTSGSGTRTNAQSGTGSGAGTQHTGSSSYEPSSSGSFTISSQSAQPAQNSRPQVREQRSNSAELRTPPRNMNRHNNRN